MFGHEISWNIQIHTSGNHKSSGGARITPFCRGFTQFIAPIKICSFQIVNLKVLKYFVLVYNFQLFLRHTILFLFNVRFAIGTNYFFRFITIFLF